ncbi:type 1 fimbriae regulatory protein FimE [Klebsiella quasipneumoniae]|nr:type 1 fimbriae regulatory protein FimE [Klebsiella quasipneumoniae]
MNRRRFLTAKEVQAMMQAARQGATGERDYCLILLAFRHGMRISELLDLHYHDLDLREGRVNVRRLKNGFSTIHPLRFDEREAIERWSQVRAGWKAAAKNRRAFYLPSRDPRSHASRRIVLFAPPGKRRVP